MEMPPELRALFTGLAIAAVIAIVLLVFGDRPELAAFIRAKFGAPVNGDGGDHMSSAEGVIGDDRPRATDVDAPVLAAETNTETAETSPPATETLVESFYLGETTALARLVAAGAVGLTVAIKIGADAKSGEKYQKRSRDIKAMVDQ